MAKDCVKSKYITPRGEITGFISIFTPSTTYDKKGTYQANILLTAEEGQAAADKIREIAKEQYKKYGKGTKVAEITQCVPYSTMNDDGEEVVDPKGRWVLKAKASAFIEDGVIGKKIQVLDSKLKPIKNSVNIGSGTIARLGVDLVGYSVAGKTGVSVKLQVVQIIDLVEYQGNSAADYGFTEEDGSFDADNTVTTAEDEASEEEELDF